MKNKLLMQLFFSPKNDFEQARLVLWDCLLRRLSHGGGPTAILKSTFAAQKFYFFIFKKYSNKFGWFNGIASCVGYPKGGSSNKIEKQIAIAIIFYAPKMTSSKLGHFWGIKKHPINWMLFNFIAERQGFEPWDHSRDQRFSRPPRSTTPAPLQ